MFKLKHFNFYCGVCFVILSFLFVSGGTLYSAEDSVNVDLSVVSSGGGGGGSNIYGCTDPGAINYDSNANQDDGSCVYEVPNVTDFIAEWNENTDRVELSWVNPAGYALFDGVVVVRTQGALPNGPDDGVLIYDGPSEEAFDYAVTRGQWYIYTIFVRSTTGDFSSGVLDSTLVPACDPAEEDCEEEEPPVDECDPEIEDCGGGDDDPPDDPPPDDDPPDDPPPDDDPPDDPPDDDDPDDEDDPKGPFDDFPDDPIPPDDPVSFGDFIFTQPGEKPQYLVEGGVISIDGTKNLTVSFPADKAPQSLKTIGITLWDSDGSGKNLSFILRLNKAGTFYMATLSPFNRTGTFKVRAYIFNFEDQTMQRLEGRLVVASLLNLPEVGIVSRTVAASIGVAAILTQTILVTSQVRSLTDLYLVLSRIIGALLGFFGIKRKNKPWGTVYDSVTKRPIDPAYVRVLEATTGKEVNVAITDIDGRYGFLLTPGKYLIKTGKTNYTFPSMKLMGRDHDELYANLYFGEVINVTRQEVVNKNIPLDPIGFDWNEFTKSKSKFFKVYSHREIRKNIFLGSLYFIGFLSSVLGLVISPNWFNIFLVVIYITLYIGQKYWAFRHKPVQLRNKKTGEPLPFSIIRFYLEGTNTEIKSLVSDALGRFYVLIRPGTYYFTVDEKLDDGTYKTIHTSLPKELKKGIMRGQVEV
ncbi:MAG: hypothetical protein WDZ73_01680 [Candidatus Paceibacterota bacterium]